DLGSERIPVPSRRAGSHTDERDALGSWFTTRDHHHRQNEAHPQPADSEPLEHTRSSHSCGSVSVTRYRAAFGSNPPTPRARLCCPSRESGGSTPFSRRRADTPRRPAGPPSPVPAVPAVPAPG